jgi:hypothetical protein
MEQSLFGKLILIQVVKKFLVSYGTWRSINVLRKFSPYLKNYFYMVVFDKIVNLTPQE